MLPSLMSLLAVILLAVGLHVDLSSAQVCQVTSLDGHSHHDLSPLAIPAEDPVGYVRALAFSAAFFYALPLPAGTAAADYLVSSGGSDTEEVNLLVNVCDQVYHPSCSPSSSVCLVHATNPALSLNLGAVRYQPDLLSDEPTLMLSSGDVCQSFPRDNGTHLRVPYSTLIHFVCDAGADTGSPAFQDYDHDNPCEIRLVWRTRHACANVETGLPLWIRILLIIILLTLSALFSGLTLGLLSLDLVQLEILIASGTPKEKKYAQRILPVRKRGNYLLCTLLLGNVIVNSSLSIIMADLTSGIVGLIVSTLGIVIFGEIIPQAICHKYGLAVGAYTVWLVKVFMVITFPLSFPISKALDFILGAELGTTFTRDALKELVHIQNKQGYFSHDEVKLLSGALDFKSKTAADIMVPMEKVFMVSAAEKLDLATIQKISDSGHSRIPIYFGDSDHIVGLLLARDLAFLNPEDETPLRTILEYYGRQIIRVYSDVGLDDLLREFRETRVHMAVVWQVTDPPDGGDPVPKNLGIVTLEDVIEEIIQMEIDDETDIADYKKMKQTFGLHHLKKKMDKEKAVLSPQQRKAISAYLSGDLEPFNPRIIQTDALEKLLDVSTLHNFDASSDNPDSQEVQTLYEMGKPADFCTIVLQGKIQITSGADGFASEIGPFTSMALRALSEETYVPDFSATPKGMAQILKIKRSAYHSAIKATEISLSKVGSLVPEHSVVVEELEMEDGVEDDERGLLRGKSSNRKD